MLKKILSIVPSPLLPANSGGQKATYFRLSEMAKSVDITVITDTQSTTEGHNFRLKPLIKHNKLKYLSIKNAKIIKEQIEKEKPDIVLLDQTFMGLLVYWACKKTSVPYAVYNHNIEYLRFKSIGKTWWILMFLLEKFTYKNAKSLFFVTDFDKQKAIKKLKADKEKCHVATYGIPQEKPIFASPDKIAEVRKRHAISTAEKVFMFFGVLNYVPNLQALEIILKKINPILKEKYKEDYKILICGGGLPDSYNKLQNFEKENVVYAGFVNDINEYVQSADVILNPVQTGGGIKTKVVEALGFNKNVVSTQTGAIGISVENSFPKLTIVNDNDWVNFADKIIQVADNKEIITNKFFENYTWKANAKIMIEHL